jgi:hypothetical protein
VKIKIPSIKFLILSLFFSEKKSNFLKYERVIGVKKVNARGNDTIKAIIEMEKIIEIRRHIIIFKIIQAPKPILLLTLT